MPRNFPRRQKLSRLRPAMSSAKRSSGTARQRSTMGRSASAFVTVCPVRLRSRYSLTTYRSGASGISFFPYRCNRLCDPLR